MSALKHWNEVHEEHARLVEFLEWLESGEAMPTGVRLQIGLDAEDRKALEPYFAEDLKPERLADRFLGVDRKALERERRELLGKVRKEKP